MGADDSNAESGTPKPDARAGREGLGARAPWLQTLGGLLLLVLAAYVPALRGGFLISDDRAVVQNPRLTDDDGLRRIWFSAESEQYQPLAYTSYWLERRIWGLRPGGYHLVNVVLHAANVVLVWLLLTRIGVRGAAVAAVLFAVHPVNVESVAWIYERKNVLSGLFYFLTFAALFRFDQQGGWHWYGIALLLFVAALLSKASTVVLPAVLLLYWWWRRTLWQGRKVAASIPFFVLAGLMAVLTIWYEQQRLGGSVAEYSAGFAERFARAGSIVAFYLGKAIVPYNLMFFYPRWSKDPSQVLSYVPHTVLLVALIVLVAKRHTWGRPVLFGLGSYLIALFPVLGFFDIYYHRFSFVADHFQYLALVALIALCVHGATCGLDRLGWIGTDPATGKAKFGGRELGVLVVAVCWLLSWQRAQVFRNTGTLCQDTLARNPDSWVAHHKLGEYLFRHARGNWEPLQQAVTHFERAVELKPDNPFFRINLGQTLIAAGQLDEGLRRLREAVELRPDVAISRFVLGNALCREGRFDEGIPHLREAVRLNPDDPRPAATLQAAESQRQISTTAPSSSIP